MDGASIVDEGTVEELSAYYELDEEEINGFEWDINYGLLLKEENSGKVYIWQKNSENIGEIPLNLICEGAEFMMVSEYSDFSDTSWEPYSEEKMFTLSPGEGEKVIYTKFKNSQGKEVMGKPATMVIKQTAPEVTITSPEDGFSTTQPALTIEGSLNEPCFKVLVNRKETTFTENSYNLGIILKEGQNYFQSIAFDLNGNIGRSSPITVTLDG